MFDPDDVCDFCSEPGPTFAYAARDFVFSTELLDHGSLGGWAACPACRELIEAGDRPGLTERSLERFQALHGPVPAEHAARLRQMLAALHEAFWRERRK